MGTQEHVHSVLSLYGGDDSPQASGTLCCTFVCVNSRIGSPERVAHGAVTMDLWTLPASTPWQPITSLSREVRSCWATNFVACNGNDNSHHAYPAYTHVELDDARKRALCQQWRPTESCRAVSQATAMHPSRRRSQFTSLATRWTRHWASTSSSARRCG
jgi:hypothetical protein